MDLVNIMYRYINKFINSDELLMGLENIDLSKYSNEEKKDIEKLITDVKNIKDNIENEVDEVEFKRLENLELILGILEDGKNNKNFEGKTINLIEELDNKLQQEKGIIRDGGKLYSELFELLTKHPIIVKYSKSMDATELFEFITKYISAPMPPVLTQEEFNELVKIGIKKDKRESLWRLAFNYNRKNKDFSLIEDYFIHKRDGYYLVELISAVEEDLDLDKIIKKVMDTKDKEFINDCARRSLKLGIITEDDIKKLSIKL